MRAVAVESGTPAAIRSGRTGEQFRRLVKANDWLALPAILVLLALFAYPIASVLVYSVGTGSPGRPYVPEFTLENYWAIAETPVYLTVTLRTLRIGLIVTVASLLMAYPVALSMAFGPAWVRRALMIAVVCPIMISAVVRSYGWILVLGLDGPVNAALIALGVVSRPVKFIFNELGVVIGLIHVYLPFMILPLASVLSKLDTRLIEAARVLGAGNTTVFFRVIVPSSLPGIAAGSTLVFTLSVGALVTPALLGGTAFNLLAPLIAQKMMIEVNWPMGSALAVLLVVISTLALALSGLVTRQRRSKEPKAAQT